MRDDPFAPQCARAERAHLELAAREFAICRPRRKDGHTEAKLHHFFDGRDAADFHHRARRDVELAEIIVHQATGVTAALIKNEWLRAQLLARERTLLSPRMS